MVGLIVAVLYILGVIVAFVGLTGWLFCFVMFMAGLFGADVSKNFFSKCLKVSGVCTLIALIVFAMPFVYEALFL